MLKRFRIPALVLTVAGVMTAMPAVSQARDRDDNRGRGVEQHQTYRRGDQRNWRDGDRDRSGFAFGAYANQGHYCDKFGVWHSYGRR